MYTVGVGTCPHQAVRPNGVNFPSLLACLSLLLVSPAFPHASKHISDRPTAASKPKTLPASPHHTSLHFAQQAMAGAVGEGPHGIMQMVAVVGLYVLGLIAAGSLVLV